MKKWRKDIATGLKQFRSQAGSKMSFRIIPAACIHDMIKAAREGDRDAANTLGIIERWMALADRAVDDGVLPGCACCEALLGYGEVCGWALLEPLEPKSDADMGVTAVFCSACIKREFEDLMTVFLQGIGDELGAEVVRVQ